MCASSSHCITNALDCFSAVMAKRKVMIDNTQAFILNNYNAYCFSCCFDVHQAFGSNSFLHDAFGFYPVCVSICF